MNTLTSAAGSKTVTMEGSRSFTYAVPLFSFPGRAGLDLNLTLYYNSLVWTSNGTSMTLNATHDDPSPGFRMDYGYIDIGASQGDGTGILVDSTGTTHQLIQGSSGFSFVTNDSTNIQIQFSQDFSSGVVTFNSGSKATYTLDPTNSLYRPTKIEDTNGNFINIIYNNDNTATANLQLGQIHDSVGRTIFFKYDDATHTMIQAITAVDANNVQLRTFTFNWTLNLPVNFAFTQTTGRFASGSTINVLSGITRPNGTQVVFNYGDWGIVNQVKELSGNNALRYSTSYNFPLASAGKLSSNPTYTQQTVFDGVNTGIWSYSAQTGSNGLVTNFSATDPSSTVTAINFLPASAGTALQGLPSQILVCSAAPCSATATTLLRTVNGVWGLDSAGANPRLSSSTTILEDGTTQSEKIFEYDTNGNVRDIQEFDYGSGHAAALVKETVTTYATLGNGILNRPSRIVVQHGAGVADSRVDINYDEVSVSDVTTNPAGHDAAFTSFQTVRGNPTSMIRYSNPGAATGGVTTKFTYDALGNLLTDQTGSGALTQRVFSSATGFSLPDSVTVGPAGNQYSASFTYAGDGQIASSTDANGGKTTYTYDTIQRLATITTPDQIATTISLDDLAANPSKTMSSSANSAVTKSFVDGLGRNLRRQLLNGTTIISQVTQSNDILGRPSQISNPSASTPSVFTTYSYDALGRVTQVTRPSVEAATQSPYMTSYSGTVATTTDPAGRVKKTYSDVLGRLIRVDEPGLINGQFAQGSLTITGSDLSTANGVYDSGTITATLTGFALSAVRETVNFGQGSTAASVAATMAAAFNKDPFSPVNASVPAGSSTINFTARLQGTDANYFAIGTAEQSNFPAGTFSGTSFPAASASLSGGVDPTPSLDPSVVLTTTYSYDPLGHVLQINQGQQVRTYQYDGLGRTTSEAVPETANVATTITYQDTAPLQTTVTDPRQITATSTFDSFGRFTGVTYSDSTPGVTYTYGVGSATDLSAGRIAQITDAAGTESYQYDNMGHIIKTTRVINGNTYITKLGYTNGALSSVGYPSGRLVGVTLDATGRLSQISSGGTNLLTINSYNPAGQVLSDTYGNGMQGTFGYNDQQQLSSIQYGNNSGLIMNLSYAYGGAQDNGQIASITDALVSSRSTQYTYDELGRLKRARTTDLTSPNTWLMDYRYDRYGNRLEQIPGTGTASQPMSEITVDPTTNHITSLGQYDPSGNLTSDGNHTYTFNAVNQITTVDGANAAVYDYSGRRIINNGNYYIYAGGHLIAEYANGAAAVSPSLEFAYAGGQRIATFAGGAVTYPYWDHLSKRAVADANGNVVRTYGSFPFGETWYEMGTLSKYKFTTYERDAASGLDYAQQRFDSPAFGRFMSLDPLLGVVGSPQTLNRYAYVTNDPINQVDPSGLFGGNFQCLVDEHGNCVGGNGPDTACSLDGIKTDCGIVGAALALGAATTCPNNDCRGIVAHDNGDGTTTLYKTVIITTSTLTSSNAVDEKGNPMIDPTTGAPQISYHLEYTEATRSIPVGIAPSDPLSYLLFPMRPLSQDTLRIIREETARQQFDQFNDRFQAQFAASPQGRCRLDQLKAILYGGAGLLPTFASPAFLAAGVAAGLEAARSCTDY